MNVSKQVKGLVPVVSINGKQVYATPTGIKVTQRGKVLTVREVTEDKGQRRRIRKALRQAGFTRHSAQ